MNFNVFVHNEITELKLNNAPTKQIYKKGEKLNLSGGVIEAAYGR